MPEIFPGVSVDKDIAFGRPTVTGSRVSTAALASRFRAGESVESLSADYRLWYVEIESALRFELLSNYRRNKLIERGLNVEKA